MSCVRGIWGDVEPGQLQRNADGKRNKTRNRSSIYLGDGTMIHAGTPATGVKIGKPWGNYWFVRVGI
jgi:hypothetical protein